MQLVMVDRRDEDWVVMLFGHAILKLGDNLDFGMNCSAFHHGVAHSSAASCTKYLVLCPDVARLSGQGMRHDTSLVPCLISRHHLHTKWLFDFQSQHLTSIAFDSRSVPYREDAGSMPCQLCFQLS